MNPLQQHYAWVVKSSIGLAATIQLATYLILERAQLHRWVSQQYQWLFDFGHISIGPLIGYLTIKVYETRFWKLTNPECDFDGKWHLVDHVYDISDATHIERAHYVGEVDIEQTATRIVVQGQNHNSDGTPRSSWRSTSCEVTSDFKTITQSIEHMRFTSQDGEHNAATLAVEIIRVVEWTNLRFGRKRPLKMRGITYHCVNHNEKSYRVETEYDRL